MKNIYGLVVIKSGSLKYSKIRVSCVKLKHSCRIQSRAGFFKITFPRLPKFDRIVTAVTMKHK